MTKPVTPFIVLACSLMLGSASASAVTVDFTGAGTTNYEVVSQNYGDSTSANFTYQSLVGGDNWGLAAAQSSDHALNWAQTQYSGDNAIFSSQQGSKLELRIDAGAGFELTNVQFNIGSYPNVSLTTAYRIYDGNGNLLDSSAAFAVSSLGSVWSLASTNIGSVILQLGDNFNVGVTSVTYDVRKTNVSPVPIPAALPLFLSALGMAGYIGRRKKV